MYDNVIASYLSLWYLHGLNILWGSFLSNFPVIFDLGKEYGHTYVKFMVKLPAAPLLNLSKEETALFPSFICAWYGRVETK